ncbi:hypothetical protein [Wukongibacter sp. M2B1]|uniref:hypothetical protein n=1 Tax=Wukongibacter sp. M2B1 TaxID=3088895 RepID=UPI003D7B8A88
MDIEKRTMIMCSAGTGKTFNIFRAIEKMLKSKKEPDDEIFFMVKKALEDVINQHGIEVSNDQLKKMTNNIVKFLQGNLFRNYLLVAIKLYSVKQRVCNKQYWLNKVKHLKSKMGDAILTIIITKVIEKLIEILTNDRRSNRLPNFSF